MNWERNTRQEQEALALQARRVDANAARVEFYKRQITEAIKRGKSKFDAERFMQKDAPK